jgi:sporulation integral membrane protein YtvI
MEEKKQFWMTGIKYAGITLGVYAALRWILPFVIPFLIALLLAKWLYPLTGRLRRGKKLTGSVLLILVFVLVSAGIILGVYALSIPCQKLLDNRETLIAQCQEFWSGCCCQLENTLGIRLDGIGGFWKERLAGAKQVMEQSALDGLMNWSTKSIRLLLSWCGILIVVVVASFYMLHDYEEIRSRAKASPWGRFLVHLGRKVLGTLGVYLRTQCILIALVSAICVLALWLCKNPYAVVLGIIIGVCDALPFLGTGTIFIPWALIDLLRGKFGLACIYAITYGVCTFVRELLEPRLMGSKLDVHPVAMMISIYVGLCVYGISGVLLGPVTLILVREIGGHI